MKKIFNSLKSKNRREIKITNGLTVRFKNDAGDTDPAEVLLYEDIGRSPWSDGGISAADFANALKEIPRTKEINFRINSRGGDVHDGMAMHNLISQWPNKTTAIIDGVAASTASWIPMACDEIHMPATAQMFIHDAMCFTAGNAEQLRKDADNLDTTSDQIAGMYADKSGKSVKEMRAKMQAETLMTGTEAHALGLVDKLVDTKPIHNFSAQEINSMKEKLALMRNSKPQGEGQPITQPKNDNLMNKTQMLALLNRHGVKYTDAMTDAELLALVNAIPVAKTETDSAAGAAAAKMVALENRIQALTEADNAAKKLRIENAIQAAIDGDKIPTTQKAKWVENCMKDETILEMVNALPAKPPGAEPLPKVEITGEAFNDVQNFIVNNGPKFTRNFFGPAGAGRSMDNKTVQDIHSRAVKIANAIDKHRPMLVGMFNTNTIDAELQRTVILNDLVRAYAKRLLPLQAFCTTFLNMPLEGTDKVAVPYFDLQTAASTDWVAANGYVTGDTTQTVRDVTINKRKYQGMAFTSQELRRQPYQNWQQLAMMNAEKLGVDVNADVLSIITNANFGAAVKTLAPSTASGDDVADLYGTATDLNWPDEGRSLVLTTGYKVALLKDPTFKQFLAAGTTDALRKAQIKEVYGFEDVYTIPTANLPTNGENLGGFITHKSAAVVATAPIMPAPAVRALMAQYDLAVDAINGIALEYKLFGDTQKDKTNEIVEANYGYNFLRKTSLGRITTA